LGHDQHEADHSRFDRQVELGLGANWREDWKGEQELSSLTTLHGAFSCLKTTTIFSKHQNASFYARADHNNNNDNAQWHRVRNPQ